MKKLIPLLLCCLLLCGCIFPTVPPAESIPTKPDENVTENITEPATAPQSTAVTIYYGNENADGFETTQVMVEEVDMNILVQLLIDQGVLREGTLIQGLAVDGDTLYMDFNSVFADLIFSMGSSGEYIVLGSVVNTFLDAFHVESAWITVDNQILESGHNVFNFALTRFE